MGADLVVVGVVLLVVGLVIVPEVIEGVVPPVVDRVIAVVERVATAILSRNGPPTASLPSGQMARKERVEGVDQLPKESSSSDLLPPD